MSTIKARRLLSDLFKEGVEIRFGKDPQTGEKKGWIGPFLNDEGQPKLCPDDQVAMFITPADPLQREIAMREANAKRARALVRSKREESSEEHLTIMAFLADMDDETLVDYVILGDTPRRRADAEREILALDEWKDMESYQDAMRQFSSKSPEELLDDPEWEAMMELDEKFATQIEERELELRDAQRDVLRMRVRSDRGQVERQALDKRAEMVGTQAFMNEYELQMTYFSVRDPDDITKLFFDNPEQLARQPEVVREAIHDALMPFITDGNEAKNSLRAASGSPQSELPSEPEISASSIPVEQNA